MPKNTMAILLAAGFFVVPRCASAGIVFDAAVTEKITPFLSFKMGDANFDPSFTMFGGKADIQFGAEGELAALADSQMRRSGRLVDVIERKFKVTGNGQEVRHTLKAAGQWTLLQTKNVAEAFYDLTLLDMDEVFEVRANEMIRRAVLMDMDIQSEIRQDKTNSPKNINLSKSQKFTLLPGDYILRSTLDFRASYRNASWSLGLRDQIFGPQGLGSGGDERGFQSRLIPIPEPSTLSLLGLGLLGFLGHAHLRRRAAA